MEYEFEGKEVKKRYIYPYLDLSKGGIVKNLNTPSEKSKGGIVKNLKDNISTNKSINKSNNNISDKSDKESDLETRFNNLWKIYPNKKVKPKALLAYKRAVKSGTTDEEIKTGLENYLEEIRVKNTQQNYIKHGSTWFNGKGWSNPQTKKDREYMTDEEVEALINGLGNP